MKSEAKTVTAYLADLPEDRRKALKKETRRQLRPARGDAAAGEASPWRRGGR